MSSGAEQTMDEILDALRSIRGGDEEAQDPKSVEADDDILDLTETVSNSDLDLTKEPPQIASAEAYLTPTTTGDVDAAVAGAQIAQSLEETGIEKLEQPLMQPEGIPTADVSFDGQQSETIPSADAPSQDTSAILDRIDRLGELSAVSDVPEQPSERLTPDSVAEHLSALQGQSPATSEAVIEDQAVQADALSAEIETPDIEVAESVAAGSDIGDASIDTQVNSDILNLVSEAVVPPQAAQQVEQLQVAAPAPVQEAAPVQSQQQSPQSVPQEGSAPLEQAAEDTPQAQTIETEIGDVTQESIASPAQASDETSIPFNVDAQEDVVSQLGPQGEIGSQKAQTPSFETAGEAEAVSIQDVANEAVVEAPQATAAPTSAQPVRTPSVDANAQTTNVQEAALEDVSAKETSVEDLADVGEPVQTQADMIAEANATLEAQSNVDESETVATANALQTADAAQEPADISAQNETADPEVATSLEVPSAQEEQASIVQEDLEDLEASSEQDGEQNIAQDRSLDEGSAPKGTFDRLASLGVRAAGVAAAGAATIGLVSNTSKTDKDAQEVETLEVSDKTNADEASEKAGEQESVIEQSAEPMAEVPQVETQERETAELSTPKDIAEERASQEQGGEDKVEKMVLKLLRPALDGWLDRNMPNVLEKALKDKLVISHVEDDSSSSDDA